MTSSSPLLPTSDSKKPTAKQSWKTYVPVVVVLLLGLFIWKKPSQSGQISTEDICVNPEKLIPSPFDGAHDLSYFRTPEYKKHSMKVWGGAVKIPTQTYDDIGPVGEDPRWEVFFTFEKYLLKTFPHVAEQFSLDHVNTHGLVFTYNGTNPDLKPLMLTAHQDVVPVPNNTLSRWPFPPFEAHYDGKYLWGRGSSDCKNNLIGIMEALEALLEKGFEFHRTVILAFGFDEEASGRRGAKFIGEWLVEKYGEKPMFLVLDEGGMGVQDIEGTRYALPSTGEKGYIDITIDLITTGGHSSVPPRNTAIGIMSQIVNELEVNSPPVDLGPASPYYSQLMCQAKFSRDMDPSYRKNLLQMTTNQKSRDKVYAELNKNMITKAMAGTTQAIDIVNGGMKVNSLPEKVTLTINYRISYEDTPDSIKARISKVVKTYAAKYGLNVTDFDAAIPAEFEEYPIGGFFLSSDMDQYPSPVTNTTNNPSWDILGGTLRNVFEDFAIFPDADTTVPKEVVVAPSVMTGNTDVRHYLHMSDNLYRYTPVRHFARKSAHAIGEHIEVDAHLEGVAFYYQFLRNVDAYEGN